MLILTNFTLLLILQQQHNRLLGTRGVVLNPLEKVLRRCWSDWKHWLTACNSCCSIHMSWRCMILFSFTPMYALLEAWASSAFASLFQYGRKRTCLLSCRNTTVWHGKIFLAAPLVLEWEGVGVRTDFFWCFWLLISFDCFW